MIDDSLKIERSLTANAQSVDARSAEAWHVGLFQPIGFLAAVPEFSYSSASGSGISC
jgi:hypothetical protein